MRAYYPILIILFVLFANCNGHFRTIQVKNHLPLADQMKEAGITYLINGSLDLQGQTIIMPANATLKFEKDCVLQNGHLIGNHTKILSTSPFLGRSITISGCELVGRKTIRDVDVFAKVQHTQYEIQTLFDVSGGKEISFSPGIYHDVEKIVINGNIKADFNNSTIQLFHDNDHVGECFYMEPQNVHRLDYVWIKNLKIKGYNKGYSGKKPARRCIQLFHVKDIQLDNISVDSFYGGSDEFRSDAKDLLDKSRIGTCAIALMYYDKCVINNCKTNDINKEIFWCVPNNNPNNETYFTNNKSTCSSRTGSSSFFTLLDGKCIVKDNEVHNYNGSAFNVFCYDSEIANNAFYNGKRSVAIDLSEGIMYRAKNVYIHNNVCVDTKGLLAAYGEDIIIKNNNWVNNEIRKGDKCVIVTIVTRGGRVEDGKYIGCGNNPEINEGSKNILVENNVGRNNTLSKDYDVRFASVSGDDISFINNKLENLNAPVVQFVEGSYFDFENNSMLRTKSGRYGELLINKVQDVSIRNNTFSDNHIERDICYTVQILAADGSLIYKNNSVKLGSSEVFKNRIYIPCYIKDQSKLKQVEYYVDGIDNRVKVESRLNNNVLQIKTNLPQRKKY